MALNIDPRSIDNFLAATSMGGQPDMEQQPADNSVLNFLELAETIKRNREEATRDYGADFSLAADQSPAAIDLPDPVQKPEPVTPEMPQAGIMGALSKNGTNLPSLIKQGAGTIYKALEAEHSANRQIGQKLEESYGEIDKIYTKQIDDAQRYEQNIKNEFEKYRQESDSITDKFINTPPTKTVGQVMANRSTMQKFAFTVALAASSDNPGMQRFLLSTIDSEIKQQEAEYDKTKELGNMKDRLFNQFAKQTDNLNLARMQTTSSMMKKVVSLMDQAKEQYNLGPKSISNMMKSQGDLMMRVGALDQEIQIEQMKEAAKNGLKPELIVPGFPQPALSSQSAEKLRESKGMVDAAVSGLDELLKIADKPYKSLSLEQRARAQVIAQQIIGLSRQEFLGPGIMDKNERLRMEDIARDPTKINSLSSKNKSSLKEMKSRLNLSLQFKARAAGALPYDTDIRPSEDKFGLEKALGQ